MQRIRSGAAEASRFLFGVCVLSLGAMVLAGCTRDEKPPCDGDCCPVVSASGCTNPDCRCECHAGVAPDGRAEYCYCDPATCTCPCPHVEFAGELVRVVDENGPSDWMRVDLDPSNGIRDGSIGPPGPGLPTTVLWSPKYGIPEHPLLRARRLASDGGGNDPLPPAPPGHVDPQRRPLEDLPLPSWPQAENEPVYMSDEPTLFGSPSGLEPPHELLAGDVPQEVRVQYWNKTRPGSCVQCSIGMCGCAVADENASLLLWESEYGPPELHGSTPSRVAEYSRRRGLSIWNVTGVEHTYDWMKWACANGRPCAISCNQAHFQTLLGHDPATNRWYVCDNNSPDVIDVYDDREFRSRHEAMGRDGAWCVVLDTPPAPPRPEYSVWWTSSPA